MASAPALHLFPTISTQPAQRKASIKKSTQSMDQTKLQGVAVHVSTSRATPIAHPETQSVQRVMPVGLPSNAPPQTDASSARSHRVAQRQPPRIYTGVQAPTRVIREVPVLGSVPENKSSGFTRQQAPQRASYLSPQNALSSTSGDSTATSSRMGFDKVSTMPENQYSKSSRAKYAEQMSVRSGSPTLVRSNSDASHCKPRSPQPMNSLFPQYDHSRSLREQQYYPTRARSAAPTLPNEMVSKTSTPEKMSMVRKLSDPKETFVDRYEHIRRAGDDDMMDLWKASCCHFPVTARKLLLTLYQPQQSGTCLSIGTRAEEALYSMTKDRITDDLIIKKHCPTQSTFTPVAQLTLPDPDYPTRGKQEAAMSIFPQMAAIHAQGNESAATSSKTPEAARAAHKVYSEAYLKHSCQLVRTTRKRESHGVVTATYTLKHPSIGVFPITVSRSTRGEGPNAETRAKISLHHTSATPPAIAAETLVLAFLDFARDACVLDTPALVALEGTYIIDTVVAALLAVAAMENDALVTETEAFEPPPKAAIDAAEEKRLSLSFRPPPTVAEDTKPSKKWFSKKNKKQKPVEKQVDLPLVTQGALAVLGVSLKTAVWLLETGVKVTAGVVVGVSNAATKA